MVLVVSFSHWRIKEAKKSNQIRQTHPFHAEQRLQESQNSATDPLHDTQLVREDPETAVQFYCRIISMEYSIGQLAVRHSNSDRYKSLRPLDGMRVVCFAWIILCGVSQMDMSAYSQNPWAIKDYYDGWQYNVAYAGNLGFDELFFFSAILATLKIEDYIRARGKLDPKGYCQAFAHRFLRLAPIYYLVFLVGWQVGPYLGDGPVWFTYERQFANCSEYWWSVFTMTINFFPSNTVQNEGCYYWGWFPASELQIFILLPWIIYGIISIKSIALQKSLITLGILAGLAVNYYVIWHMNKNVFGPSDVEIFYVFINKPYTKLYAVFAGIGFALIYSSIQ